ncbi:NAD(P)/FAD-dependent oxidoreductase [Cupriavidus oxalaticus]|uniref:FAD-dependent oxidoreductase n=1 Tax=Cupriavidus oxalaticus TaxID=96344 RepID=A0A375GC30_9BURK|nr:FAD-dependent oxidoreductase [Cupriavidus oxalaticus]QRQ83957.1 FAD-dependent oxidoreductase [Cupriavidus oxalaticus]QRQ91954.1 FAD-dependent oxidoreductase [Cupriavidus oxalaticus]WQD86545.1 FAD-dependent oxidoreductase [Cupriavidus oxalaticus]SPC19468.1 Ferredoxin reductase [Cupriavidus oxalaticus]
MTQHTPILIIGAGQAGAMAAAALRGLGYGGRIVMAGSERHAPYERPPLSKSVLADAGQEGRIGVHPASFYADQDIELRLGACVTALDPAQRVAHVADGSAIGYDACLLTTGGNARVLAALPPGTPHVHYLRSLDDATRLRDAMRRAGELVVIGGGFLGLETASTAAGMGLKVTLVESADRLLGRALPPELGTWLADRVRAQGVTLRLGCGIAHCDVRGYAVQMRLADGSGLRAPLVVVAIGLTPEVTLAAGAGLALHPQNGGIRVDQQGRTSAPGIHAAGDCCSQHQPLFGTEMRLESWQSANEQARIAAASMLGVDAEPAALPWFWTDQFGCNVQMLGAAHPDIRYAWRGSAAHDAAAPKFMLLGTRHGRLSHAIAVNAGGDLRQLRPLVGQDVSAHLARLCDGTLPLRQVVRQCHADADSSITL